MGLEEVSTLQGILLVLAVIIYVLMVIIHNKNKDYIGVRENLIEAYNENFALKDELRHLASNPNVEISKKIGEII